MGKDFTKQKEESVLLLLTEIHRRSEPESSRFSSNLPPKAVSAKNNAFLFISTSPMKPEVEIVYMFSSYKPIIYMLKKRESKPGQ